jgi:hypothetical protein
MLWGSPGLPASITIERQGLRGTLICRAKKVGDRRPVECSRGSASIRDCYDAKERAERENDLSVRTTYRAMADDWAARLKDAEQEEDRKKFSP